MYQTAICSAVLALTLAACGPSRTENQIEELDGDISDLQSKVEELESANSQYEEDIEALKAKVADLEAQISN